jgi:release factor glutamine methyltransferase
MATVGELLRTGADLPGESPQRDAEILLGHCLKKSRTWLYTWPDEQVEDGQADHYQNLLQKRLQGQPVAYLTGQRAFWSLALAVNSATLIPRPETETLVAWALELSLAGGSTVLDLGTGSGAIALALASENPAWSITAVDQSEAALEVARMNANNNGINNVCLHQSNWFDALGDERFSLIVSNPPYIDDQDKHLNEGDVRFEPRAALVAADEGLADLNKIIATAPQHLTAGASLLVEHGFEQGAAVRELFAAAGFTEVETRSDLAGNERVTGGVYHAE